MMIGGLCHLVSVCLLCDPLGDLHGAVSDLGEGRVQAPHGVVAVRHLKGGHRGT